MKRLSVFTIFLLLAMTTMVISVSVPAQATTTVYDKNTNSGFSGFESATGNLTIGISFDDIAAGTNISGTTINGIKFDSNTAPLFVVKGTDTYTPAGVFSGTVDISTNKLFATSGANVLSPGGIVLGPGPNDPIENDGLILTFSTPAMAFGFDHLSQSADGLGYTYVYVYTQSGLSINGINIPIHGSSGGAPGGADFWGVTTTNDDKITKIVITEIDNNATYPDCNIGYDSFYVVTNTSVPEPPTMLLFGSGLIGLLGLRRKMKK
jgi:hypothetical protein